MPTFRHRLRRTARALTRYGRTPLGRAVVKTAASGVTKRIATSWKKSSSSGARRSGARSSGRGRTSRTTNAAAYDGGSSGCSLKFKRRSKFMKGFKKVLAPQILNSVCGGSISTVANRQTPYILNLYTGTTAASTYLMSASDNNDMNQILSGLDPSATIVGPNSTALTRRYMVESIRCKVQLKNQTTIPITLTLYDCVARRDNATDSFNPLVTWNGGILDEVIPVGVTNSNAQGSGFPGAKPFQSQTFCQRWNVKRATTFILHPGATHCHWISIRPAGLLNFEYTRLNSYLKGLTTALMVVVKGGVAASSTNAADIGESVGRVDYTSETQYRFKCLEKSRTALTQFNTLAGLADRTINEDQDTIIPNVTTV